jgi:hypothetical protein
MWISRRDYAELVSRVALLEQQVYWFGVRSKKPELWREVELIKGHLGVTVCVQPEHAVLVRSRAGEAQDGTAVPNQLSGMK